MTVGFFCNALLMATDDRMDTEEEEEDDETEGQSVNMVNHGVDNVDSHGELEGDFVDEVSLSVTLVLKGRAQQSTRHISHPCA